jgi:hypothetical protein
LCVFAERFRPPFLQQLFMQFWSITAICM